MKAKKNLSILVLSMLGVALVGCGETTTSTPAAVSVVSSVEETPAASSDAVEYPYTTVKLKTVADIEVGETVTANAIVASDSSDLTCTFTVADNTIVSIEASANKKSVSITGLKAGSTTVTATSVANPTVSSTITVTVIPTRPALRGALENIDKLTNFTILSGEYDDEENETEYKYMTKVDGNVAIRTDADEAPILSPENDKYTKYYGIVAPENGYAVYLSKKNGKYMTDNSPVVTGNIGLLDSTNFLGRAEKAVQPDEVGQIFTFAAINPNWVTDVKSEDNTYVIDSGEMDVYGAVEDQYAAYTECVLWKLIDPESYDDYMSSLGQEFYFSAARAIDTEVEVLSSSTLEVTISYSGATYKGVLTDVGTTEIDSDYTDAAAKASGVKPTLNADLTAAVEAIKTNNYVQINSTFPDHQTEFTYNTYFTPTYVFYDCDKDFITNYDLKTVEDKWIVDHPDNAPYGYVKKSDGIYHFVYNETEETVTVDDTKVDGTDATTDLPTFEKYYSTCDMFDTDKSTLLYSFEDTDEAIWNGRSTKYHQSNSYEASVQISTYYAPEDLEDQVSVERSECGIGVEYNADKTVKAVNSTVGYCPYTESETGSTHTYGVEYFTINEFGNATVNRVDSLLNA